MFEVINNRGKQLSELEKVKNYLIYCCVKLGAHELRETINADWSNVLRNLNDSKKTTSSDEDSFLRYCVAVHFKLNKTDSQYGYDELKKALAIDSAMKDDETKQSAIVKIDNFIKFVKISALWYARLYGRKHDGLDNSIIQTLDQIRAQQQHASIMPLFLALVIKHQGRGENLVKLLKLIEILNFRVYMSRRMTSRNDTGQGDLYYFASRYYHDELLQLNGPDERKIGKQLINSEDLALEYKLVEFILWHAPNERFKSSFILESGSPDDFYDWGGLRYFLMSYEAKLQPNKTIQIDKILRTRQQGKSADYLSIEHLWAQNHRNKPGENDREQDRFQKRRLGNFVLLELRINIQGSDQGLEDKLPLYISKTEATDLFHVRKMDKDARNILKKYETRPRKKNYYFDIHNELNNLQEGRYISFAESRWSVEKYLGYRQCIKNLDAEED